MKKRLFIRGALFVFISLFCSMVQAGVEVIDDAGRVVRLEQPARRIISLAPHNTENLFTAGAGAWVVGVSEFSDYPTQARSIPRVGGYYQLNLEKIIELEPDLIVVWQSGNPSAFLTRLEQLGFTLFYSEPRDFEQILSNIRRLARLTGTEASVSEKLKQYKEQFSQIEDKYAHKRIIRTYYQVWDNPMMTLNGEHLISDLLRICGGRNVFRELSVLAPQISVESVLEKDPEIIVIPGTESKKGYQRDFWSRWDTISAVKNSQIYFLDADELNRHTLRVIDAANKLCQVLDLARVITVGLE